MLCYPADSSRDARRYLRRAHALAANQRSQILVGKLQDELLHGNLAIRHIGELITLVSGPAQRLWQMFLYALLHIHRRRGHRHQLHAAGRLLPVSGGLLQRMNHIELLDGRHGLGQLLDDRKPFQLSAPRFDGAAHIAAHIEVVGSRLQHIGGFVSSHARVIVGSQRVGRHTDNDLLTLSRHQQFCLGKSA